MRQVLVDGKPVIFWNNLKTNPPLNLVKNVYRKIPDEKRIPIIFMTRLEYLKEYIKNQEKINGTKYSEAEKSRYIAQEMPVYRNIISRYTTKKNPYFPPAVVFFNDYKIPPSSFDNVAFHEFGHEYIERNGLKVRDEEEFADNFMRLKKAHKLPNNRLIKTDIYSNTSFIKNAMRRII